MLVIVLVLVFFGPSARLPADWGLPVRQGDAGNPGSAGASLPRRARYRYDPTLRLLSRQLFTLGLGKIFELFFGHRLGHLLRRAFEGGFTGFAALG